MDTVDVQLGERSYPIYIGSGLLADDGLLSKALPAGQLLVVTNEVVAPLYLDALIAKLDNEQLESLVLPDGEQYKTLRTFESIIDRLIELRFHRDACIAALGGGVVGDIAGFAAACYQRGIDFVQIPTTLLAQVDSAVGGKTAVNHPRAKNMIGAFYQPRAVISDTDTLTTLVPRQLAAGLAEIIKYGLIVDKDLFGWLEENIESLLALNADALRHAIRRSCEIKAAIVAEDELEHGKRALLNLGHTFGHALEALGGYARYLHGEAVAIGMVLAAETSRQIGGLSDEACERLRSLLLRARLPIRADGFEPDAILDAMQIDKKAGRAGLKLILLDDIGRARVGPSPQPEVLRRILSAASTD